MTKGWHLGPGLCVITGLLFGCASTVPSALERKNNAVEIASSADWVGEVLHAQGVFLQAFRPKVMDTDELLAVYLEGDGLSWIRTGQVSRDPTPIDPIGLRLALAHSVGNAVYIARPCQYTMIVSNKHCDFRWWTSHRFAPEVTVATSVAIDEMKKRLGAKRLQLVGYSGGGALATLLAAQRNDVTHLVTIAGNLDHAAWTKAHKLSPLNGSLNPADWAHRLSGVSQIHFTGEKDNVIPFSVTQSFLKRLPKDAGTSVQVHRIPGFDHHCCWAEQWQKALREGSY